MDVHSFFSDEVDVKGLAAWLDGLAHPDRVEAVRALSASEQARLFEAAKGHLSLGVEHFVPREKGEGRPVIHYGRNSLPVFRIFEKRFCRPAPEGEIAGYNEQATRWATGPGYFVVRPLEGGEVLIDYTRLPEGSCEGWPALRPNSRGLSRFVYHGTQDVMRGVSRHVSIGRASRGGKLMKNWFVLCREP